MGILKVYKKLGNRLKCGTGDLWKGEGEEEAMTKV